VIAVDGRMVERLHLTEAESLLARAAKIEGRAK
jgi:citrate lyase beta subunit